MPRLIFLTGPLIYMLLGMTNIPGYWVAIVAYAMPHLYLANLTNFRTQALYRYTFWNEIYETVLAPYILGPTVLALINPKLGKFNVTAKGGKVQHSYFDEKIAWPYIVLIFLNVAGLVMVPIRLLYLNPGHPGTIAMNAFWIMFNLVILATANAVAYEPRQLRAEVRISMRRPVEVRLEDGESLAGETLNMSLGGVMLKTETEAKIVEGSRIRVVYLHRGAERVFAAVVVGVKGNLLRMAYESFSLEQEEQMTLLLYTDADMWLSRSENRKPDKPILNFLNLLRLSAGGLKYALFGWMYRWKREKAIGIQAMILILALACQVSRA
jgi:cellulose synthase (UDP-forming)